MKKDYTKPVMEIVSFTTENITEGSGINIVKSAEGYQSKLLITTIDY